MRYRNCSPLSTNHSVPLQFKGRSSDLPAVVAEVFKKVATEFGMEVLNEESAVAANAGINGGTSWFSRQWSGAVNRRGSSEEEATGTMGCKTRHAVTTASKRETIPGLLRPRTYTLKVDQKLLLRDYGCQSYAALQIHWYNPGRRRFFLRVNRRKSVYEQRKGKIGQFNERWFSCLEEAGVFVRSRTPSGQESPTKKLCLKRRSVSDKVEHLRGAGNKGGTSTPNKGLFRPKSAMRLKTQFSKQAKKQASQKLKVTFSHADVKVCTAETDRYHRESRMNFGRRVYVDPHTGVLPPLKKTPTPKSQPQPQPQPSPAKQSPVPVTKSGQSPKRRRSLKRRAYSTKDLTVCDHPENDVPSSLETQNSNFRVATAA